MKPAVPAKAAAEMIAKHRSALAETEAAHRRLGEHLRRLGGEAGGAGTTPLRRDRARNVRRGLPVVKRWKHVV